MKEDALHLTKTEEKVLRKSHSLCEKRRKRERRSLITRLRILEQIDCLSEVCWWQRFAKLKTTNHRDISELDTLKVKQITASNVHYSRSCEWLRSAKWATALSTCMKQRSEKRKYN